MSEQSDHDLDWTDAQCCPFCGEKQLEDNEDWDYDDAGHLVGEERCENCDMEFRTVSRKAYGEPEEEHTLQFVPEMEDDRVVGAQAVARIEAGEDDAGVVGERARLNMIFGGAAEVQGPPYAVEQLFQFIAEHSDLPEEESGEAGDWILSIMEDEE